MPRMETAESALRSSSWMKKVTMPKQPKQPGWREIEPYNKLISGQVFWNISTKKIPWVFGKKIKIKPPFIKGLGNNGHTLRNVRNSIAHEVKLTEDERPQSKDGTEMHLRMINKRYRILHPPNTVDSILLLFGEKATYEKVLSFGSAIFSPNAS